VAPEPPATPGRLAVPLRRRWTLWPGLLAGLALVVLAAWAAFNTSVRQGTDTLRAEAGHQLDLFAQVVQGVVRRLEPLPGTVQLAAEVQALLQRPDAARVATAAAYLRRLNAHLGSASIFVLDERGQVLAASDAALHGQDLSFRPYFLEALSGRVGRHFAIGLLDGQPGYYVSHPIHDGARVAGVAVMKVALDPIDRAWDKLGAPALLADSNQVVILSSRPEWRYTALSGAGGLSVERRVALQTTRLYADRHIAPFPLQVDLRIDEDSQVIEALLPTGLAPPVPGGLPALPGPPGAPRGMLVLGRTIDGMDWRLLMFADLGVVREQALSHALLAALTTASALMLALLVNQRRRILRQKLSAHRELEAQVARRTQALSEANEQLRKEVAEREAAEATLRGAQDELVHAGKMAALGQLATGITHELTQPLGAIRTLSANAVQFMDRGQHEVAAGNLAMMARLADQMGAIIEPLKGFARKSSARPAATPVDRAMRNALFLHDHRLRREGVAVIDEVPPGLCAWCDPNRLEQVLINLVGNAADAMHDAPRRELRLWAGEVGGMVDGMVEIHVSDCGSGLPEDVRARLFEPFFSTKADGGGLGLGLAISRDIAREAGGELEADNAPGGGARFILRLPVPLPSPPNPLASSPSP
jgi:two-component system C4-dicarboxylate transport sensor histidine kinase DctB